MEIKSDGYILYFLKQKSNAACDTSTSVVGFRRCPNNEIADAENFNM